MPKFKVEGEEFDLLTTDDLLFAEARAIQKATGVTLGALMESEGDVSTMQALMWVSMKRSRPTMTFFDLDQVPMASVEWIDDEEPEVVEPGPTLPDEPEDETSSPPSD